MKKFFCFLLTLAMLLIVMSSFADDIDLSNMSIEELATLRDRCQAEIMKSDKWQEVTVPAGVYQIGKEIPAGYWTIRPVEGDTAELTWGTALNESGASVDAWNSKFCNFVQITSPTDTYAKYNNVENVC